MQTQLLLTKYIMAASKLLTMLTFCYAYISFALISYATVFYMLTRFSPMKQLIKLRSLIVN